MLPLFSFLMNVTTISAQGYAYKQVPKNGYTLHVYDFDISQGTKVKYFAQLGYQQYQSWQYGKKVSLLCAGAFSEFWTKDSAPVGFTIDNGRVANRDMDSKMDGFVMIINGKIDVIDLDNLESGFTTDDGIYLRGNPRSDRVTRAMLLRDAVESKATVFQTQLLYSKDKSNNFQNLEYGDKRERRFLAIAKKNKDIHYIIIDIPKSGKLNQLAKYAYQALNTQSFQVDYILNLDTGGKNIFYVKQNGEMDKKGSVHAREATNLIILHK